LYLNAVGASAAPLILIAIAGRFGRISWVDSSLTYVLILKSVGGLTEGST
jgi:hypothetical protein